ncbi:hypothetical protein D3C85_1931870 [compost metagenome]
MSTISSTRLEDGKNCCCTNSLNATSDRMNAAAVSAITVLRWSRHHSTVARKRR